MFFFFCLFIYSLHVAKEKEIENLTNRIGNLTEKLKNQKAQIDKLEQEVLQGFTNSSNLNISGEEIPTSPQTPPRVDSMIKIVCNQRDRLQAKLQKLENVIILFLFSLFLLFLINICRLKKKNNNKINQLKLNYLNFVLIM